MTALPRIEPRVAVATGRRLVPAGPRVAAAEATAVVADLHGHASRALDHVHQVTGLAPAVGSVVSVLDRGRWIEANSRTFSDLLAGLGDVGSGRVASTSASIQLGALLSYLSTRVLGQFDPWAGPDGLLMLLAPNVLAVERRLGLTPADFRLWVCVHEQTHRVQFGQARWLADHLRGLLAEVVTELDGESALTLLQRLRRPEPAPGPARPEPAAAPTGPAEDDPTALDRLTAAMSLLEGHAEVMTARVGPGVIPTASTIGRRIARRRVTGPARVLQRVLGMEAKLAQYRDGARFVRHVLRRADRPTLNTVFDGPDALPTLTEIHQPQRWLQRV